MTAPLTGLSSGPKNTVITLTAEAIKSFNNIKKAPITTPVLQKFDWLLPIIVESDASKIAVEAALLQTHTHSLESHPSSTLQKISYFSKKLTPYSNTIYRTRTRTSRDRSGTRALASLGRESRRSCCYGSRVLKIYSNKS